MFTIRYEKRNTDQSLSTIIGLLKDSNTQRLILYASPTHETEDFCCWDGADNNFPLVAALVEYKIPGIDTIYIVFDGMFLTLARNHYSEVCVLLDTAVATSNAYYAKKRAPFTSSLEPEAASEKLLQVGPLEALTAESRPDYFELLSITPECEIKEQLKRLSKEGSNV